MGSATTVMLWHFLLLLKKVYSLTFVFSYIYMNDNGKPYFKPKDFETLRQSLLLKGMFSASIKSANDNP